MSSVVRCRHLLLRCWQWCAWLAVCVNDASCSDDEWWRCCNMPLIGQCCQDIATKYPSFSLSDATDTEDTAPSQVHTTLLANCNSAVQSLQFKFNVYFFAFSSWPAFVAQYLLCLLSHWGWCRVLWFSSWRLSRALNIKVLFKGKIGAFQRQSYYRTPVRNHRQSVEW